MLMYKGMIRFTVACGIWIIIFSVGCLEPPDELSVIGIQFPASCIGVSAAVEITQNDGKAFLNPVGLKEKTKLTEFFIFTIDFDDLFDFTKPLDIRLTVNDVRGECPPFKVGQVWEFHGTPTLERIDDEQRIYVIPFKAFVEVQQGAVPISALK